MVKLFCAFPIYGKPDLCFVESVISELILKQPCPLEIKFVKGESLIPRGRDTLSALFLKSDCTHLLFCDSDQSFTSENVSRLLSHNLPLVGGFVPKKIEGPIQWAINALANPPPVDARGLQEVQYIGSGFLLVRRDVFEAMKEEYGDEIWYRNDETGEVEFDFWPVGPYTYPDGSRRYLSEDWYFCQRWADLGGKVYGDTGVIIKHTGEQTFPTREQLAQLDAYTTRIAA